MKAELVGGPFDGRKFSLLDNAARISLPLRSARGMAVYKKFNGKWVFQRATYFDVRH